MYFNPADKTPFIRVWNGRVAVARWRKISLNAITSEDATNWEALEDEANEELERQGGWRTMSGNNPCPHWLAAKATWPE